MPDGGRGEDRRDGTDQERSEVVDARDAADQVGWHIFLECRFPVCIRADYAQRERERAKHHHWKQWSDAIDRECEADRRADTKRADTQPPKSQIAHHQSAHYLSHASP